MTNAKTLIELFDSGCPDGIKDLCDDAASHLGGGELILYAWPDPLRIEPPPDTLKVNQSIPDLRRFSFDNKTSSLADIRGTWRLFTGPNYTGDYFDVRPGKYTLLGSKWNNKISSIQRVG
jgi:hypothetical protein